MKKMLFYIVINILFIAHLKAQTCQQLPSCESLGFNKTPAKCYNQDYIKCPFDETKVYCSYGNSTSTDGCDWGYILKNGSCQKIENAIAFVIKIPVPRVYISFSTSGAYAVDWGDGTKWNLSKLY